MPTYNIPDLITKISRRCGVTLTDVPQRYACESMARKLGVLSELQTAEVILNNSNCTLGFDATTQEEVHVNSIHITTKSDCFVVAVDELPGATAEDYCLHISNSFDNLARVYSHFHEAEYQTVRKQIIANISNTLTDHVATNHAAIQLLDISWNKSLNEWNCHLHPLDSIGKVWGRDCIAGNIVLAMNKLRFKNGKGDPRGFATFLYNEQLPRGIIPRYRGNRLHILFHICGIYVQYHSVLTNFLETGTLCGGLRASLLADFVTETALVEIQVLGLIGKILTGPWMKTFYTSSVNQIDHIEGIYIVQNVIKALRCTDFFANDVIEQTGAQDKTLEKLREPPKNEPMFRTMMTACLQAAIVVLERQYIKYFEIGITEKLKAETKSARSHNIDAEEVMGMFSAVKNKSPNATLCFISCKMRALKNQTVDYIDSFDVETRGEMLKKAVLIGRQQRIKQKLNQKELMRELPRRMADKHQKREQSERRKLEKRLKSIDVERIMDEFPDLDEDKVQKLSDLLTGKSIGHNICHVWLDGEVCQLFNGRIEKMKGSKYVVAYWKESETYVDAIDFDMSIFELAADLLLDELVI